MTAEAQAPAQAPGASLPKSAVRRSPDWFRIVVWGVVAVQSVWLGALMSRGWYYQADLANLAEATNRSLSWSYLSAPQGGHFVAPVRFVLWVLNRVDPLNYSFTIVLRLAGQALATVLLARLLVLLVGRRPIVLGALLLYAFSPFLIQASLWLSAAIGLVGAQLLLITAVRHHVLYAVRRRTSHAVATAACVLGATLLSEQAAVTAVILPILSVGYLAEGTLLERLRQAAGCWREWLLICVPMLAYVAYYFSGSAGYGVAAHRLGPGSALRVVQVELTHTIVPGLIGGPWEWFGAGDNYLGLSSPSTITQVLCAAAVVAVIGVSVRVQGWRGLLAWSLPVVVAAVGIVVVAIGRYHAFGVIIAEQFEHAYYAAFPAALALCLAFSRVDLAKVRERADERSGGDGSAERAPRAAHPRRRIVAAVAATAVVISSCISGVAYADLWSRSPARHYVTAVEDSVRHAKPGTALYDVPVPPRIIPLEDTRYLSAVIGLTGLHVDFGYAAPRPSIMTPSGRIVRAKFFPRSQLDLSAPAFCDLPVQGAATVVRALPHALRANDWYLELSYFQQYASVLSVSVLDKNGAAQSPTAGRRLVLASGLGRIHLLFLNTAPAAIRITALSPATNLCITAARVGFPFPAKAAS